MGLCDDRDVALLNRRRHTRGAGRLRPLRRRKPGSGHRAGAPRGRRCGSISPRRSSARWRRSARIRRSTSRRAPCMAPAFWPPARRFQGGARGCRPPQCARQARRRARAQGRDAARRHRVPDQPRLHRDGAEIGGHGCAHRGGGVGADRARHPHRGRGRHHARRCGARRRLRSLHASATASVEAAEMHTAEKLVYMANQIGTFFAARARRRRFRRIADHIKKFWDPRMRERDHRASRARRRWALDPEVATKRLRDAEEGGGLIRRSADEIAEPARPQSAADNAARNHP